VKYMSESFIENALIESDSSFFDVFYVPLLRGDKKTVLNASHTLVLSESTAKKIFGKDDPIDKTLIIGDDKVPFKVTGIMADIPETSHFNANMIASFMSYSSANDNNWGNSNFITYILLKPNTKPGVVDAKMSGLISKYMGPKVQETFGMSYEDFVTKNKYKMYLQPLKDIHFNQAITQNTKPSSNPKYLYIFGSIAILIIIIAAINYMNLSTAQASKRAKEVGIKKVSGSSKGMLIRQFLTESLLLSVISLLFAIIIIEYSLPYFNNLIGIKLQMHYFNNWFVIPVLIVLSVFIGLLAGSYPAFFLSSFSPSIVLKGKLMDNIKNGKLRSILVIIQFSISIILIVGTMVMFRQIQFMQNKDLGFSKENLLIISRLDKIGTRVNPFKDAIAKIPEVIKVASSTAVPGQFGSDQTYSVESKPGEVINLRINYIDYDFFDTYGIKFSSGRSFNGSFSADKDVCIVNESAIKQLNLTNTFTSRLIDGREKFSIVGIVKNFHFESLHNEINPYVFRFKNENINFGYLSIRLSTKATAKTIKEIEKVWKEFTSNDPLQYFFMDQEFAQMYKEEKQNAQLSVLFSLLAVMIAALGLFGLTSFTIKQRTKEIGIHKIYGSKVTEVMIMLNMGFLKLVAIAFVIATPIAWYAMHKWLQGFAYKTELSWWIFGLAGIIALGIALLTVSWQSWRAATRNPVEALRYE
jgi:putative ABC transport system permease protein